MELDGWSDEGSSVSCYREAEHIVWFSSLVVFLEEQASWKIFLVTKAIQSRLSISLRCFGKRLGIDYDFLEIGNDLVVAGCFD